MSQGTQCLGSVVPLAIFFLGREAIPNTFFKDKKLKGLLAFHQIYYTAGSEGNKYDLII